MTNDGALDRSTLDSKDKGELRTIAEAMGGKPPSRAKKADIIDLILEMAGAGTPADDGESEGATGDAARRTASNDTAADDTASDDTVADGADSDDGSSSADDAASEGSRSDDADDSGSPESRDRGGKADRSGKGDRNTGDRSDKGGRGDKNAGDTSGDKGRNQDRKSGDNVAEPGNRRRRRRRGNDQQDNWNGEPESVDGYLELRDDGYGFLRVDGALPSHNDVYVPVKQVREFGLRRGDHVIGTARPAHRNEKNPALLSVDYVNGKDAPEARNRPVFDDLTPVFPDERLRMERPKGKLNVTTRIIDIVSPIGKGQRGLIVAPPKAGKTTVIKEIVRSIEVNNPEVKLFVVLVDERPEEVTDMQRWLERGEVIASTFDKPTDQHAAVAELTVERAKRMVEMGEDVVIVLDGITRLARAYNLNAPSSGRIMSGGVEASALYPPKRFFGAARKLEEGGSLTILATALVETGSKMDEVIFEEFKGTGNMELRLDRYAAQRQVWPAISIEESSTRRDELLCTPKQRQQIAKLRRVLDAMSSNDEGGGRNSLAGLELLIDRLIGFETNDAFLEEIAKAN